MDDSVGPHDMDPDTPQAVLQTGSEAVEEPEPAKGTEGQERGEHKQQEKDNSSDPINAPNADTIHAQPDVDVGGQQAAEYGVTEYDAHQAMTFPVQGYTDHSANHGAGTSSHHQDGLTFSGPPYVPKARPYARADFSHSNNRLMKIAFDNQKLVQRLTSISRKEPSWSQKLAKSSPSNVASSAVNRRKAATTIAQENHALYQRLVAIKPSKDISRETLEAEHRQNESYRINCASFKATNPAVQP